LQDTWDTFQADNNNSIMDNKKSNNPTFLVMLAIFLLYSLKICMEKLMGKLLKNVQREAISGGSNNQKKSNTIPPLNPHTRIPIR